MYLVTNLTEKQLSTAALRKVYPLRWGIELQFRAAKQTFGIGKLRSRTAGFTLAELEWSLTALTMIQLLALREQIPLDLQPSQASVALAIEAIRNAIDTWSETVAAKDSLTQKLSAAVKDEYKRSKSKQARYQPNYKDKPHATKPVIVKATVHQRRQYKQLFNAA
jgi:DNA-binding protein H-NS